MAIIINFIAITLVVIILTVIIYIVSSINKNLKEKIGIEKNKLQVFYERYESINKENPEGKDLDKLDQLARDLFKEKDNMDYKISYVELANNYKNQNAKYDFCNKMSKIMYSKDSSTSKEILEAINLFSKVIEELHLPKIK